ncbi:hypothetical protein DPMN_040295 [Dreissena polymorpha]|uniref:Uncharacterized protein n=1 Tax=Dreissena polymorpha TaxID=45954 RepID=A0A9D4CUS2_DREPO|nr:hypothetical protein DPMN_040295 [Dreissena polymorpha]
MEICTILTRLGYGEEVRRWRVDKYKEFDRLLNARTIDVNLITVGSKAEGLTCFYESDSDLLYALKRVLCVEAGINLGTIPDDIDVFRMDTRACPGHCRLLQERKAHRGLQVINNALCENGYGGVLLSSGLVVDEFRALTLSEMEQHERAGPSIPGLL